MGKIHYGKRKDQKKQKEYDIFPGIHKPIVSENLWNAAHTKRKKAAKRQEKAYDKEHEFQLSGVIKCPICGKGMVGNISRKKKPDGTLYKTYFSYRCNNKKAKTGRTCSFYRQPGEELMNNAVREMVVSLVNNPMFSERMKEKVNSKVDTSEVDADIMRLEKNLKSLEIKKNRIISEIDGLDILDATSEEKERDLKERLDDFYVRIVEIKQYIQQKREEKIKIEQDKITGDTIYNNLLMFAQIIDKATDGEKKRMYRLLIKEIEIYEEQKPDGRWVKNITFNFPVYFKGKMVDNISWVTESTDETIVLLSKVKG